MKGAFVALFEAGILTRPLSCSFTDLPDGVTSVRQSEPHNGGVGPLSLTAALTRSFSGHSRVPLPMGRVFQQREKPIFRCVLFVLLRFDATWDALTRPRIACCSFVGSGVALLDRDAGTRYV